MGNEDNPWGNIVIQQPSTEGEKITPSSTTISYQDIIDEVEDLTLKSRLEQISESYRNRIITFVQNNFVYN
jgi:hypothetical protein